MRWLFVVSTGIVIALVVGVLLVWQSTNLPPEMEAPKGETPTPTIPQPDGPAAVTISTDKTDYRLGETVTIDVRNGLDKSIWFLDAERGGRNPWWGLQRREGGAWTEKEIWKPTKNECVVVVFERVPLENLVQKLEAGSERADQWTLANCVQTSSIGPKLELAPVEPGIYRLFFRYGLDSTSWKANTTHSEQFSVGGE